MANREQVAKGIASFIETHMLPKSEGNYRIILRTVKSAILVSPDALWKVIDNSALGKLLGEDIDLDTLEEILTDGFGNNEMEFGFKLFGNEYKIYVGSDDIHKLKTCIERCGKE